MIVTQKMFGYCGRLRAVSFFVNRSAMFVEAVFKSTFGFALVLKHLPPKTLPLLISLVRVSQGFWGTREQRENIVGNKGT